ncbi:MAG: acetyl-CoA carboxylase biotin carboxyl carrier protein subunit [Clostridiales bacterium]|nr:acetyl-CoA carboxylase biotin carboxyl carrier protein subunit [Clostridiales bacterium]
MRNFVITVNGKSYQVGVEEVGASVSAPVVSAPVAAAPVVAPVTAAPVAAPAAPAPVAAAPANGEKVLSPFPGLIKNLLVEGGATVKKDQPILVLEAMKMDNDITAPCDGVVTFQVAKGANVESDAVLAVIG